MAEKLSGRMKRTWEDRFWRAYHLYLCKMKIKGEVPDPIEIWAFWAYGMIAISYAPVSVAESLFLGDFQFFFSNENTARSCLSFFWIPRTDEELIQGPK